MGKVPEVRLYSVASYDVFNTKRVLNDVTIQVTTVQETFPHEMTAQHTLPSRPASTHWPKLQGACSFPDLRMSQSNSRHTVDGRNLAPPSVPKVLGITVG